MKFESKRNSAAAIVKANQMADEFTRMTGIKLVNGFCYIDSPMYGYTELNQAFPTDDPEAIYVVRFKEADNNYEEVCMIPSYNKAMVWRSLSDDNPFEDDDIEGAVDPKTGDCEWVDYVGDGAYPMSMWRKYRG